MAGLNFDITCDNTNFMEKLREVRSGMQDASKVLEQVGKNFDTSSMENKVVALNKVIKDNETSILSLTNQLNRWQEEAREAFNNNDMGAFNAITKDIEEQAGKIQVLVNETEEYKKTLSIVEASGNLVSSQEQVSSPQLFKSQEDYEYVQQLKAGVEELQNQIAAFDGDDAGLQALRNSLSSAETELRGCESAAAAAASRLGGELGGQAAEASTRLYELNSAVEEQSGIVKTLSEAVSVAAAEWEALKESGADTSAVEDARIKYDALSESLQNANNELLNLQAAQTDAGNRWNELSQEIETHDSIMVKMLGGYDNYKAILGQLPGPVQSVIKGMTGMTGAAKAFIATPIGAIISAIVLALQALKTWFDSSAEGQMAFAKVSGYVSGILNQLKEIVITVGKAIYNAFNDPKKAISDLWEAIKTNLVNRVTAVGGIFSSLGKIIKSTLSFEWDDAKEGFKELGDQAAQLATGIENMSDKMAGYAKKTNELAKANADLNVRERQLARDRSNWQVEEAKLDEQISEARKKMYSGTDAERLKATQQAQDLLNKKYEKQIAFAQEEYDIIKARNTLTTNGLEDYDAENKALAQITELQAERNSQQAMFARREASLTKSTGKAGDEQVKQQQQLNDKLLSLQEKNQQAEIALMEDGTKKKLAEIENSYRLQTAETEKLAGELAAANAKAGVRDVNANGLTGEQQEAIDRQAALSAEQRTKAEEKVYEAERESMRAFLKEYGTYEQQRLAITEEYARKMADASDIYEKMQLEAGKNRELQTLAFQFKDDTNWETIFTNIDNYTVDYLQEIQQKLKELLGSEDITADQAEAMGKQLERVNQLILKKSESWADAMGLTSQRQRELNQLLQSQLDAQDRLDEAQQRYNDSLANTQSLQGEIAALLEGMGIDTAEMPDITAANAGGILSAAQEQGASDEETKALEELIVKLGASQAQDATLQRSVDSNTEKLKAATKAYEGASKKDKKEQKDDAVDIAEKVADGLRELGSMSDLLGLDEGIGATFDTLADGVNSSINAFKDFESGNYIGAVVDVLSAVGSFGDALGIWGDSDKTLMKDIERMTAENEDLERAISELTNVISENTTSLADASDIYQQTIDNVNQEMANTAEMMQRSAAAYKSGMGGSRSSNYRIDKNMSASDWKRVSEAAGTSVSSAEEFFQLTSEQMYQVSVQATDLYSKIKQYADDGYRDAAQYMDDYIMYWQELEELTDTYNEKLTSTTFDSVVDSFKSAIMDMNHSTADFAQDFEDMMKEAMIDSLISSTYASSLQKWYEDFAAAMESGSTLDAKEQESLRSDYMDIVSDAKRDIEALYDTMGWSTSATQSASSKGFETMSQDTAEELSGRFTALQVAGEDIRTQMIALALNGDALVALSTDGNALLSSILNQQVISNGYLEDIARYTKPILEFGNKLDKMTNAINTL